MPAITHRDPATGRFITAEAFARLSALNTPVVVTEPGTGKKAGKGKKKQEQKTGRNKKRSPKSSKKKSPRKKSKKH